MPGRQTACQPNAGPTRIGDVPIPVPWGTGGGETLRGRVGQVDSSDVSETHAKRPRRGTNVHSP